MDSQLGLFECPGLPPVACDRVVVAQGPYGMSWIEKDAPVSADGNPLFFKCSLCGKVSSSAGREAAHKPGCWHPYAERVEKSKCLSMEKSHE